MKVWTVNRPSKHPGENGRTFNVSLTCSEDWPESGEIPKRLVDVREVERLEAEMETLRVDHAYDLALLSQVDRDG